MLLKHLSNRQVEEMNMATNQMVAHFRRLGVFIADLSEIWTAALQTDLSRTSILKWVKNLFSCTCRLYLPSNYESPSYTRS